MGRVGTVVLVGSAGVVASWPLVADLDLTLVDRIARLALGARRIGWRVLVRDTAPGVADLLRLTGVDEVLQVLG